MQKARSVDVLVIGGGPVGLLTAYQLARAGCSVYVVDKDEKSSQVRFGRANALYARSAELLDQLGLAEDLVQQCHVVRESYTYNAKGERVVPGRVWNFVENIDDSKFDFGIMLRQQSIEASFRDRVAAAGAPLHSMTECLHFDISDTPDADGNYVTALLKDTRAGIEYSIKSKYLVGADGGQSFVRKSLDISFEGSKTEDKWVRIDGKVKSNIPTPRHYASIESPTHGNVLWAPLDRGITRIGYVFTSEQEEKCGGTVTEEVAIQEAIQAMKPFSLEFERVEWWTLYVIGQRVAATYQPHPRAVLAGDACHTHSSGAAQGLNTGIHDACNLGWKLALVIKGLAKDILLETYSSERRASAQRLIAFDRKISTLMANKWPEGLERAPNQDINQVLATLFDDAAGYNTGLGISYTENLINVAAHGGCVHTTILPGSRAPDVSILRPCTLEPARLHACIPNVASMYVLVFMGDPRMTRPYIDGFASYVETLKGAFDSSVVRIISIAAIADTRLDVEEAIGVHPFSHVYYDDKGGAHKRYGVNLRYGALVVARPDSHVGFAAELSTAGAEAVKDYLGHFLIAVEA